MKIILIVDDNIEFREMMADYFKDIGYNVEVADNGREGVNKARAIKPDIILLDVMMPDVGGIEVLRELQSYEETVSIPVIVITGTYFDKNMYELFRLETNCKEFLSKTTELAVINKKIESLINK